MENKNGHRFRNPICSFILLVAACSVPLTSSAQTATPVSVSAFNTFMGTLTAPGATTAVFASNGTMLAAPSSTSLPTGNGWTNASNYGVAANPGPGAGVKFGGVANVALANGKTIPVGVTANVSGAAIGKGLVAFGKLLPVISTGIALFQLAQELGLTPDPARKGGWIQVKDGVSIYSQNDYEYIERLESPSASCNRIMPGRTQSYFSGTPGTVGYTISCSPIGWLGRISRVTNSGGAPEAITDAQAEAVFAASDFSVSPFGKQTIIDLTKADVKLGIDPFPAPTNIYDGPATGPATSVGEKTTTTAADGTTTTKTETTNITYPGGKIVTVTSTATTTTKPDGTTTTDTTTKTDTPPPTTDLCKEHPDILACAKPELDVPTDDIPKTSKTITYTAENPFGSGNCPADKIYTLHNGQTLKVWDWQQACELSLPIRAIVISLASFAAFLIVMPGETRV